ncbi:hypothetical protein EST38_g9821 [Candolleomyces aberdarensis]|uniref:G domain-containing protein n=1 Tax=Candolleomyces aberdarensis TaxID=2316362 RepID=A0A4Q2DC83_9AGAR|nr:hypothetical protein EST38_g9821 [Candolleomyces aberdarensis]
MADNTVKPPTNQTSDKDVLIAVMGLTGSGKSTFINLATQSPNKLQVGHSIQSCTEAVERADPFDLDGRRIILFDTPGFDDTNKSETEILRIIAFELEKQYRKGQTLHGIIYVHRISDLRVGGLAKTNFSIFRKLCGESSLKNVVIVTSMWSRLPSTEEGRRRVAELASLDDFFKPAIAKGAMMMHHIQDTVPSAHGILRQILKNHPMALSIQTEIVDQHKTITETGAGIALDEKLALLAQRYEQKLKEQFEAAERARRERDEETRKEQLEEAERIRQLLKKLEEEKRDQARQYQLLQERFAEAERNREHAIRQVEERQRRETNAAEARFRQHVNATERRRTQDSAELEERMTNVAISPSPPRPRTNLRYGVIVSGRSYAMYNKQHESYYATLDDNEEHLIMEPRLDRGKARQQWKFHTEGKSGKCIPWTIQSVSSGKYLCATSRVGEIKAYETSTPTLWCTRRLEGHDSQFR